MRARVWWFGRNIANPDKKEAKLWANVKNDAELWDVAHHGVQGARKTMEDAYAIIKQFSGQNSRLFAGVFDGHSGTRCAKYVAETLPKHILESENFESQPLVALKESFFVVDKLWLEKAKAEAAPGEKPIDDGSTGCVCMIMNKVLYVANCGDSKAMMSIHGELVELTTDQKPDDPAEQERIEKAGGTVINGRIGGNLSVARAFETSSVRLTPDIDYVLIACDGLFEEMTTSEAHEFIIKRLETNVSTLDICKQLVEESLDLGSQDNNSVILIKIEKAYQKILTKTDKLEKESLKKPASTGKQKKTLSKSGGVTRDDVVHPPEHTQPPSPNKSPPNDSEDSRKRKPLFARKNRSVSTSEPLEVPRPTTDSSPPSAPEEDLKLQLMPSALARRKERAALQEDTKHSEDHKKEKRNPSKQDSSSTKTKT